MRRERREREAKGQKRGQREQVKRKRVQRRQERRGERERCRWHERNKEWGKGRERVSEREQTGSSEESVRWKRQSLALYLLILFPGHIPRGILFKYLMNIVPLVHSVDFIFARSSSSRLRHNTPENILFSLPLNCTIRSILTNVKIWKKAERTMLSQKSLYNV